MPSSSPSSPPSGKGPAGLLARARRWAIRFAIGLGLGVLVGATAARQVVERVEDAREQPA